jgi:hypothetical protein
LSYIVPKIKDSTNFILTDAYINVASTFCSISPLAYQLILRRSCLGVCKENAQIWKVSNNNKLSWLWCHFLWKTKLVTKTIFFIVYLRRELGSLNLYHNIQSVKEDVFKRENIHLNLRFARLLEHIFSIPLWTLSKAVIACFKHSLSSWSSLFSSNCYKNQKDNLNP